MLLMLLDRLLRRQVHRRTRQLRSLGRLQELLWCGMEGVRARLVLQLRMQRRLLVGRLLRRLVRLLLLRSMGMRGIRASTRLLRMVLWVLGLCMVGRRLCRSRCQAAGRQATCRQHGFGSCDRHSICSIQMGRGALVRRS